MAASWECPSLPMLSFPLKESTQTTFLGIKPMISAHYEEDGDSFQEEIKQLDTIRQAALRPPKDYNGVTMLRRYFGQLHLIRERFPPETIGQLPIDFVWKDAFTDAQYVQEGLQIEQASILYNIAALHSMLGYRVKRSGEQEMKEAFTHFQCAAGACVYLSDNFAVNHASKDLSAQFIQLYKDLMLGQAQECLLEKSLKGVGRVKNVNIAKIAIRVSEYYMNVTRLLESEPCNVIVKKHKDWPKLLRIKVFYFQAVSHFYQGCHSEELGKQGEFIAWLQLSLQKLNGIGKIPKSLGDTREAAKNFFDHISERLQIIRRQNDQVYHDPIPDSDTLEQVSGADLAKSIVFQPSDPKNVGRDIFARLVPMRAYEAASVYSEEKAKLLRSVMSSVQDKEEELEQYLLSLNAEEIDKIHQGPPSTPDNVLQQHKLMQGKSTLVKKLHADIQELMKLSGEVTDDLALIAEKKEEEDSQQGQSSQIIASLWKEAENLSKFHTQASKSNGELKSMFDQHYQYLLLLSGPVATLQAAVPKLTPLDTPAENSTDSVRWKELMDKIEEMKKQRKALVGQLRDQINRDDITKTLIGHLGSDKEVFIDEQMRPHREIADIIRKNLEAQTNILGAVTEANAKKVQVRQTVQELTQQQESMFSSLVKAGTTFPLLQSKISEGLGFYTRLHGNVIKLRTRVLEVLAMKSDRDSVERRLTPDRSVSPDPARHTTPPPRPPKKAEFAGNPIAPEQQVVSNQNDPPLPPPAGGQSSLSPSQTHQPLIPPPQALAGQSLEEQLLELQRQQQTQLHALQNLNVSGGDGLDLQSVQNVVPPGQPHPIQTQPGTNLLPQGFPQGGAVPPPPIAQLSNTSVPPGRPPNMPTQQVLPGVPIQQLSEMPSQQLQAPEVPAQQFMSSNNQLVNPIRLPSSEQGDTANLMDSGSQPSLLQAPLQPMDHLLNQDSMRAIEDLQLLLQPPSGENGGVASTQPSTEDTQEREEEQHSHETVEHKEEDGPQEPASNEVVEAISPPLLEQGAPGGDESAPPQSTENVPPVSEGVPPSEGGSALPDVLQIGTGSVEPNTVGLTSVHIPAPEQTLTGAEAGVPQPSSETTVIVASLSRPITSPLQSPPASHAPPLSHGTLEQFESPPHLTGPHVSTTEGQFHSTHLPDTEPVGFHSMSDLVPSSEELQSSLPEPLQQIEALASPQVASLVQTPVSEVEESGEKAETPLSLPPAHHDLQPVDTGPNSAFRPIMTPPTLQEVPGGVVTSGAPGNLSLSASSLPQLSENVPLSSFQSIQSFQSNPLSLPTPPSVSPLPPELTMPLQEYHTLSAIGTTMSHFDTSHYENILSKKEEKIEELKQDTERQRAQIADDRIQIESYKQQLLLLQQQVSQVAVQQQKYEQEKTASSGQQAVLMQLLQQQQGMFSQQQAQLENMGKVTEAHRKEQQELESSYKQALAVEREQKNTLQSQLMQQTQEMQRLQQQLQSQAQQYQTLQLQLHQYHTQMQERDKQLVAFREQHKQIIQNLDQKHQQKVSQLVQQVQEYQAEVKKLRTQRQQSGIMKPVQPMPTQQFMSQQQRPTRPASVPGQVASAVTFPGQMPPSQAQPSQPKASTPFGQTMPELQRPPQPQAVRPPANQPQNFSAGAGPPQGLPPPLQPAPPSQGYRSQESQPQQFQGYRPGQGLQPQPQGGQGLQPQPQGGQGLQPQPQGGQGLQQQQQQRQGGAQQGFQQPPQIPASSAQLQSGGGQLMRQDSQPFRPDQQQQMPSKEGGLPPTSSFGFVPRQDVGQNWQQPMTGGNRMPPTPSTPQQAMTQPGQGQYGQLPPGVPQGQLPHGPPPLQGQQQPQGGQVPPQQFQSPGGQFQPQPGGMTPQFSPAPQQAPTFSHQH